MRLGAQPFLWKGVLLAWGWQMISISKAENLPSFWNRGPGELGNGLLVAAGANIFQWMGLLRIHLNPRGYSLISRNVVGKSARDNFRKVLWVVLSALFFMDICLRVLKESSKFRLDCCSVSDISHITFRDCRVQTFSDNPSRNSCISYNWYVPPHRIGFLRRFALKTGMVFEGNTGVYEERKRNMRIRNGFEECFCLRSNQSNDNIISA